MVFVELLEQIVERGKMQPLEVTTIYSFLQLERLADEEMKQIAIKAIREGKKDAHIGWDDTRSKYVDFLKVFNDGVHYGSSGQKPSSSNPAYRLGYDVGMRLYEVERSFLGSTTIGDQGIRKSHNKFKNELTDIQRLLKQELENLTHEPETIPTSVQR